MNNCHEFDCCDCCANYHASDFDYNDPSVYPNAAKPYVTITDWRIVDWPDKTKRLFGIPTNHPNPHGLVSNIREVMTSPIVDLNIEERWVETENTNYILVGEPLSP